MTGRPLLVTPPSVEPVSLAEFKAFARIDSDDEDGLLAIFLATARMAAENYTRRAFITQTWRLTLDKPRGRWANDLPAGVYDLPVTALDGDLPASVALLRPPIQSVTSVTSYGLDNASAVYDPANYRLDSSGWRLTLNSGAYWPSGLRSYGSMEVVTVNGYGPTPADVPQPIRTAIMIHAAKLYEERGMCGDGLCDQAMQLLRQYRVESL